MHPLALYRFYEIAVKTSHKSWDFKSLIVNHTQAGRVPCFNRGNQSIWLLVTSVNQVEG